VSSAGRPHRARRPQWRCHRPQRRRASAARSGDRQSGCSRALRRARSCWHAREESPRRSRRAAQSTPGPRHVGQGR